MLIEFFGVRGSVPAPGPRTVRYGGNTVCVGVRPASGDLLILDAGTGFMEAGRQYLTRGLRGKVHVFLSHIHWDHVLGIPFSPITYRSEFTAVYYPLVDSRQDEVREGFPLFQPPSFPVPAAALPSGQEFHRGPPPWHVGSATIRAIPLNHPDGAQGYRIDDEGGGSLAYLTDNELGTVADPSRFMDELADFAKGVDVLIHDSQYTSADMPAKRGWGHSLVSDVLELARRAKPKRLMLFHHDPSRDDEALDQIGHQATQWLLERAPTTRAQVAYEGLAITLPLKAAEL